MAKKMFFHLSAWFAIMFLSYHAFKLQNNQMDKFIMEASNQALPNIIHGLQNTIDEKLKIIQKYIVDIPQAQQNDILQRVKKIDLYTDSLLQIPIYPNILNDYKQFLKEDAEKDLMISQTLSTIASQDSFGLLFKPQIRKSTDTQRWIAQQILKMELYVLKYYESKVHSTALCNFTVYNPTLGYTDWGCKAGEKIRTDVAFEEVDMEGFAELNFFIDGKPMASPNGTVHFERTFPKPGIYPLKASISARKMRSDSLCTWEKTFYLKVQE